MMNKDQEILEFVSEFINKPRTLTSLNFNSQDNSENYLTLLHILLVKNCIKESHAIIHFGKHPIRKNNRRISNRLDFQVIEKKFPYTHTLIHESEILNHELIEKILESFAHKTSFGIYSNNTKKWDDIEVLNTKNLGRLLEYPDCCIKSLIANLFNSYEIAYQIYQNEHEQRNIPSLEKAPDIVMNFLNEIRTDRNHPVVIMFELSFKKLGNNALIKFPFCFHQPCADCINNNDSPTQILNEKYANFAKQNFPLLHTSIIRERKKEYQTNIDMFKDLEKKLLELDKSGDFDYPQVNLTDLTVNFSDM